MTAPRVARRWRCPHGCIGQAGSGRGPARCGRCGAVPGVQEGVYAVLAWRGDGRYRVADARALRLTEAAAERIRARLDPDGSTLVVRFLPPS